jgi:LAO/AO transport system kinase
MEIVSRLLERDVRAVARSISLVEDGSPRAVGVLQGIYPHTGKAQVIGVTGAPGSGKSSLVDRLVAAFRERGNRVGVIAVDPSSAFSGGAILGDRVRMQDHAGDADVYIRSMATRGHLGGLARAANDAIDVLDAAGYDPILVETVGVGQDEVDIVKTADAVAVVLVPGMGDDIQAIKAGILEIADLFVINKADRDGVDRLHADLDYMLSLTPNPERHVPTIHRTVAIRDEGVVELSGAFLEFLESEGSGRRGDRRRERAEARFLALLGERILARVRSEAFSETAFEETIDRIADRELDPYTAVQGVLDRLEVG